MKQYIPPDYQAFDPLGGPQLRLHFRGPFEGEEVLWDACFISRAAVGAACNSITIGDTGPHGRALTVVLEVTAFDAPTVHKAIIMMRQYKRLRRGRHEFGGSTVMIDTESFTQDAQATAQAVFAHAPLFAHVSAQALRTLAAGTQLQRYERDETVFRAGELPEFLYILVQGSVQLSAGTSDGREAVVELLHPYEAFVIATVLTSQRYLRSARAVEPSYLLLLPAALLLAELKNNPDLAIALLGSMAQKYRHMVREVKNLRLRTAAQRLAIYLLQLVENTRSGMPVHLPYEKKILASRLGMTPESFSRALTELRGYSVDVRGDEVSIGDLEKLRTFCRLDQVLDDLEQDLKVMLPTTE